MEFLHNGNRVDLDIDLCIKHYSKEVFKRTFKDRLSEDQIKQALAEYPKERKGKVTDVGKEEKEEGGKD